MHQLLRYWRNSLADIEKMGLQNFNNEAAKQFELNAFKAGQLKKAEIQKFFEDAEEAVKKKNQLRAKYRQPIIEEEIIINKLQVILAPYTAIKSYEHGKERGKDKKTKEVFPLWIVASLTREGQLIPCEEKIYPWIERRCLTPNESNNGRNYPIIGDVTQVDAFYAENRENTEEEEDAWQQLFSFAERLLNFFTDERVIQEIFQKQHWELQEFGYIYYLPMRYTRRLKKLLLLMTSIFLLIIRKFRHC